MSLQETMLSPVESHGRVTGKDKLFFKDIHPYVST